MPACTRGYQQCRYEFRSSESWMNTAFRRAEMYSEDKDPYQARTYPHVWKVIHEYKTIRLEMNKAPNGDRRVASFSFDSQPGKPGLCVHVVVWIIKARTPDVGDMALPSHDERLHMQAHTHFNMTLLGVPGKYTISMPGDSLEMPPPPSDDKTPPALPV